MSEAVTPLELKHPFTLESEEYTHLRPRRPKVRDMLASTKLGGTDEEKGARALFFRSGLI